MAERDTPNLALLREVAQRIESLLPRLAFLGGVVVDLFVTEPTARPSRATKDVDVVVDLVHYGQYAETLRDELIELGLEEDTTIGAPRCRWRFTDAPRRIIDIMPTKGEVLGFSTEWYAEAFRSAEPFQVPGGPALHPPCGRLSPTRGGVFWRRARCQPCSRPILAPMKRAKLVRASCCRESKQCPASVITDR